VSGDTVDDQRDRESGVKVTWLGHSTVALELDGARLLTDPLLRPHAGMLRRRAPRPDPQIWRHADAVLLSHLHHDHAELSSLRMLPGVPVVSSAANAAWLRRRGLPAAPLGDSWTPVAGKVEVRQVPAEHHARPMPHRPNDAHGHLVRGRSVTVWVAGDTGLHAQISDLAAMAGRPIDLALVPVWGWGPRLSPGHLTPEEAAQAVAMSGARYAVPVHWGTLHPPLVARFATAWLERPGERFADAMSKVAPRSTAVVLAPGDSWVLNIG
jgi:L-ascorbate metabolism protein UlaG (beta-lactamase superfamily)